MYCLVNSKIKLDINKAKLNENNLCINIIMKINIKLYKCIDVFYKVALENVECLTFARLFN